MTIHQTDIARADQLDAFWNDLLADGQPTAGRASRDEELLELTGLVQRLQTQAPSVGRDTRIRLWNRVFGSEKSYPDQLSPPVAVPSSGTNRSRRRAQSLPWGQQGRFSQIASLAAMAALLVVITGGFLLTNLDRGWFGWGGDDLSDQAIVPSQQASTPGATPAASEDPTLANAQLGGRRGVLWTLQSSGSPDGHHDAALIGGTLFRLTGSSDFTGIEAIDAETGEGLWHQELAWTGSSVSGDGEAVYIPVDGALVALDRGDGAELWRSGTVGQIGGVTAEDGVVYVWDGLSRLTALDTSNADELWTTDTAEPAPSTTSQVAAPPVVAGNTVIVATESGDLVAFDRATGQQLWLAGGFASSDIEIHVADDGTIVAVGLQGEADGSESMPNHALLLAIDSSDGSTLWYKQPTSANPSVQVSGSMVTLLADIPSRSPETVTLIDGDGARTEVAEGDRSGQPLRVYGFELATGDPIVEWTDDPEVYNATGHAWVSDQGDPAFSALAPFGPDSDFILAISDSGRLTSLSIESAQFIGMLDLGQPMAQVPFGDSDGEFVLLASGDLVRIDPGVIGGSSGIVATRSGDPNSMVDWTLPKSMRDGQFESLGGMTIANSMVYRTIEMSDAKVVQAVYGPTGQVAWEVPVDWSNQGIEADIGGVFVVDSENQLLTIDPFTGEIRSSISFGSNDIVSMTLGDRLYVWDESNTLTAVASGEGGIVWQRQTSDAAGVQNNQLGHPTPLISGDLVVMVDGAGTVHAIDRLTGDVVWSQDGFDGTNTRMAFQPGILFVLSSQLDGLLTGTGLDSESGAPLWTIQLEGPLFTPLAASENFFYLIGDEVAEMSDQDAVNDPITNFAGPGSQSWTGSKASLEDDAGGSHVFGIDAHSGAILWTRTSMAGGFIALTTGCPSDHYCGLSAQTSDGHLVSLASDNGAIVNPPTILQGIFGQSPIAVVDGGIVSELGSFATLADGSLVNYGVWHFSEQG